MGKRYAKTTAVKLFLTLVKFRLRRHRIFCQETQSLTPQGTRGTCTPSIFICLCLNVIQCSYWILNLLFCENRVINVVNDSIRLKKSTL